MNWCVPLLTVRSNVLPESVEGIVSFVVNVDWPCADCTNSTKHKQKSDASNLLIVIKNGLVILGQTYEIKPGI